jgi:hypothetical protein
MKAVFQLAFCLFYVASSYAITQERTEIVASTFQQSSGDETQVKQHSPRIHKGFPRYREAKPKTGAEFALLEGSLGEVPFLIPVALLEIRESSFKSITVFDRAASRAPPVQL